MNNFNSCFLRFVADWPTGQSLFLISHPDIKLVNILLSTTRVSLVQNKFVFCQLCVHYIGDPGYHDALLVRDMHTRRNAPVKRYIGDTHAVGVAVTTASTSSDLLPPTAAAYSPEHVPADSVPADTVPADNTVPPDHVTADTVPADTNNSAPHSTTLRHTRHLCATLDNSAPQSTTLPPNWT